MMPYHRSDDPGRIDRITAKLAKVWKQYPDWRLGQLVSNLLGPGKRDVFFLDDDEWEKRLDSLLLEDSGAA
jgi:hypothetical protein